MTNTKIVAAPEIVWGEVPKKEALLEHLRAQIVGGTWGARSQLPTRRELVKHYNVSLETVQRALDCLTSDGWIESDGRRGTFVRENPPHLSRYALIFRHHPEHDEETWTRFYTAMSQEAARLRQSHQKDVVVFTGVDGHVDSPDFVQLMREVNAQRFAGLFFVDGIYGLENSGLLELEGVPKVSIGQIPARDCVPMRLDSHQFAARAVESLARRGRTKLALICHCPLDAPWNPIYAHIAEQARAHGMRIEAHWSQVCSVLLSDSARGAANLLMHCRETPDALIITDDNLVEPATLGLLDAEVQLGVDLDVVAHANFPYPTQGHGALARLGFDVREIMERALASIDARRQGDFSLTEMHCVPRFSEEITLLNSQRAVGHPALTGHPMLKSDRKSLRDSNREVLVPH